MAKIVILGAGLTGLSTAYHLEQKGFSDYEIFEKENQPGGLCRSIYQDGFTFDYTGHLLHINDPYLDSFADKIIGKENFVKVHRRSFIYSHNAYTKYPFQINLHGLPDDVIVECIEGFLTKPKYKKDPSTFYQWVIKHFGKGIAKHFFFPFQNKILAYDIKKVTPSWTGRFVPKTSLTQMISGAVRDNIDSSVGYNSQFYYPEKDGIYLLIKKITAAIKKPINTNFCVKSVNLKEKFVKFTNGHIEKFEDLITTLPLDIFLNLLEDKSNTNFKNHNLVCNSVVNFNLGFNRSDISDKHWIYFPENEYPFYRLGFPHNFTKNSVPNGCSSLYGEFSYIKKPQNFINEKLDLSIKKTKALLKVDDSEIITQKVIHIPHAYVIYNLWREKNLPKLLHALQENSVYSIGRYGEWKYSSMQEAILDGKKIADNLVLKPAKEFYNLVGKVKKEKIKKPQETSWKTN